jgi:hypothetical protein
MEMIVDPCHSAIDGSTIYGGSTSSIRQRIRRINTASHTPSSTPGTYGTLWCFHPVHGSFVFRKSSVTSGEWFLTSESGQFERDPALSTYLSDVSQRSIGACLSVAFAGAELERRGTVYSGIVNGATVFEFLRGGSGGEGTSTSIDEFVRCLGTVQRIPNDMFEITWIPTDNDEMFIEPITPTALNDTNRTLYARTNFIVMGYIATQTVSDTVGITWSATNILEFTPTTGQGLILDSSHVPSSANRGVTVSSLIRTLQSKDPAWYVNAFKKVSLLLGRGMSAYASGGALGVVAEMAGFNKLPNRNVATAR